MANYDLSYTGASVNSTLAAVGGKADKVSSATNGDFAALDSNGNLTDSGKKASDFQTALSEQTAYTSKGTSAKVPQITTNSLGQVTSITEVDINFPEQKTFEEQYLTIVSLADSNAIGWKASNSTGTVAISISTDNGATWTSKTSSTSGTALATLNKGEKLLAKATLNSTAVSDTKYNMFTSSGNFNVEGNAMSLLYGDSFVGKTTLSNSYSLLGLFAGCQYLISAENLILPATTLSTGCYASMFNSCIGLTVPPSLPATTLATSCYAQMFYFCTSLETAPELPAVTLSEGCYQYMFYSCDVLRFVKCLATDISATNCTASWLGSVPASGTFVKADNMSSWGTGANGIPSGWNAYSQSDYAYVRHYELSGIGGDVNVIEIVKVNGSALTPDANKAVNVQAITGVTMNSSSITPSNGVVDLGTVVTSETSLSKGSTTGAGNAVTDISVSGHQITLTKGSTFLTSQTKANWNETSSSSDAYIQNKPTNLVTGVVSGTNTALTISVVSALPASPDSNTIYIVVSA